MFYVIVVCMAGLVLKTPVHTLIITRPYLPCWSIKENELFYYNFLLKFTAGLDYESLNQVLTFPAGTTTLTQCVNITILQDSAVESFVEFFNIQANSTSISVTPASVMILIQDNDRK